MPEKGDQSDDGPSLASMVVYFCPWLLPLLLAAFGLAVYFAIR